MGYMIMIGITAWVIWLENRLNSMSNLIIRRRELSNQEVENSVIFFNIYNLIAFVLLSIWKVFIFEIKNTILL